MPFDHERLSSSGLVLVDHTSNPVVIVSSAGRADDWLLSVGFDVPTVLSRLKEHWNNLNASELTTGRLAIINRIVAAQTQQTSSSTGVV